MNLLKIKVYSISISNDVEIKIQSLSIKKTIVDKFALFFIAV